MFLVKSNKKKYRFVLNQALIFTSGIIILILIIIPLSKNIKKRVVVNREIKDLEEEISTIENKNNQLDELITYLQSDNFIEEQSRLNLGLKKEGEEVLVITEEGAKAVNYEIGPDGTGDSLEERCGFFRWYKYFFKNK